MVMSDMKAKFLALAFAAIACGSAYAAEKTPLKVYDVDVTLNQDNVTLKIDLNLKDFKIPSNGEAIFTPVLISDDGQNSVEFAPVTVCGRNRWYFYLRNGLAGKADSRVYRSGAKEIATIFEQVPYQSWMDLSELDMR